jgi:hypothetical protein
LLLHPAFQNIYKKTICRYCQHQKHFNSSILIYLKTIKTKLQLKLTPYVLPYIIFTVANTTVLRVGFSKKLIALK